MSQLTLEAKPDRRAELVQQLDPKLDHLDHLTQGQHSQNRGMLLSYVDVFALNASDLTSLSTKSIRGSPTNPTACMRMPFAQRD